MHAVGDTGATPVPAFLTKLWTLVEDSSTDEFICWDVSGKSFHVFDQGRFSKEVLPLYFKHSNIASFIRQLNMYGFRKVVGVESGGLKVEKDDMEFAHQYFQRDNENLLEHIKRKVPNVKSDEMKVRPDDVQRVLHDVRAMKGKQDTVNNKLEAVKRENELLWLEIASLRQKHMKQQQIVNKLIQFLMSLVGNRGVDRKRKMPLMLNDVSQLEGAKMAKYGSQLSIDSFAKGYQVNSPDSHTAGLDEGQTPTHTLSIHEVTDQMPSVLKGTLTTTTSPSTPTTVSFPTDVERPPVIEDVEEDESDDILRALVEGTVPPNGQEQPILTLSAEELPLDTTTAIPTASLQVTPSSDQPETSTSITPRVIDAVLGAGAVVPATRPTNAKVLNRSTSQHAVVEMSEHLDTLQNDLDSLKDILSGGQYTFEPSTIMGLFNLNSSIGGTVSGSDSMFELGGLSGLYPDQQQPSTSSADYITGNEVVQYNPPDDIMTLFDLGDLSQSTPLDEDDNQASSLNTPHISAEALGGPRLMDPSASTTTSTEEVD